MIFVRTAGLLILSFYGMAALAAVSAPEATSQIQPDGTFKLTNSVQALSAHVTPQGVTFDSIGNSSGKGGFTLSLVQWGSKGKLQTAKSSGIYSENNRVYHTHSSALQKNGIIEKFSNGSSGIQQDFVVPVKLQSTGSLYLQLHVDGAMVNTKDTSANTEGVVIVLASGRQLTYDRLVVTDSKGKTFPAQLMAAKNNMMNIVVDDAKASYPLTIHPQLADVSITNGADATGSNVVKKEEALPASQEKPGKPVVLPELPEVIKQDIKRMDNTSTEGLTEKTNPDGSVVMDLQDRFQSVPIAVRDSDGKIHVYMHGGDYKPGVVSQETKEAK